MTTPNSNFMQPISGWIRFRNIQSGVTIDINPQDGVHQMLLTFYQHNSLWEEVKEKHRPGTAPAG